MKKKIIGIFVCMLMIATAIPAVGTTTKINDTHGILTDTQNPICYKNYLCSIPSYEIEWEKTYGGSEADKFWDVQETDDCDYIACGTTETSNNHCPWVMKVDSEGNEIWNWTITEFYYNDTFFNITYCWVDNIKPTSDGGCIAGITTYRFDYNDEEHEVGGLLKLDSNGEEEWMQIYGDPFEWGIGVEDIVEVEDGFIGVGTHGPTIIGYNWDYSACMFKTDSSGELIWNQAYNYGPTFDFARGFCYADDGFVIVGNFGTSEDSSDAFVVKTDSNGNEEWNKTFGGPGFGHDYFDNVFLTDDGGYMMCGWTRSFGAGSYDAWLLKTDAAGNEIWNKTFGERGTDLCYGDFDATDDGGYIIPVSIDNTGSTDGWALKVNSDGNVEWKHIYGEESGKQYFIGICSTNDGGCIASGISGIWDGSSSDAILVKYAAFENQRPDKPDKPSGKKKGTPGAVYSYKSSTTDLDGDQLEYLWDWGDGNFSDWLGPYNSGDVCEAEHYWENEDKYNVTVMARDSNGGESDWSDPLPVKMPKNKVFIFNFPVLSWLFERFPNMFPVLRYKMRV